MYRIIDMLYEFHVMCIKRNRMSRNISGAYLFNFNLLVEAALL